MDGLPLWVTDDTTIAGNIRLLRRVHKDQVHDGKIDTSVFRETEMGCGLSVTVWETPDDLEDILRGHEGFCVICVSADELRKHGVIITRHALVGNLNHCEIFPRLTGGQRKKLKAAAIWVRYADWVLPEHREVLEVF